eukprot:GHRQ01017512.1.p1 GENE.GHRQ01017512.1~~GHRQ01017512.1.p1  ORF type:complete len:122 (+),score=24.09 GHRQ01017512.1:127-492(+)
MMKSKIRWGDTLDDEDALPPTTVKGPDSHGIKITTEYSKNDKGEAIKKVTKVKVVNVEKKVYKVTAERKQWKRFGLAAKESADDSVTGALLCFTTSSMGAGALLCGVWGRAVTCRTQVQCK